MIADPQGGADAGRVAELRAFEDDLTGQAPGGQGGAPGAPAAPDDEAEARELVNFTVDSLASLWPWLDQIYTPEKKARLIKAAAPVMRKYDFTLAKFFEQWGPELQLTFVALPLGVETWRAAVAYRAHLAAQKKDKPAADAASGAGDAAPAAAA